MGTASQNSVGYACPYVAAHFSMLSWHTQLIKTWCLQSYNENLAINLTDLSAQIPSDVHMYWYTAEYGVSLLTSTSLKRIHA